jgi:hypothetical protein
MSIAEAPALTTLYRTVSLHQPDLLPYSGFWYKLAESDLMDLRVTAQIVKSPGYQRRVKMRDQWANAVLAEGQSMQVPIEEVRIKPKDTAKNLINLIRGRYNSAPHKERIDPLCDAIQGAADSTDMLWEFNLELLLYLRGVLGIDTPFRVGGPAEGPKGEGVLSVLNRYPDCEVYLSGTGAKKYMSDTSMFDEAGIRVRWSEHRATTGDSVVTLLMDYQDPMELIMLRNDQPEGGTA